MAITKVPSYASMMPGSRVTTKPLAQVKAPPVAVPKKPVAVAPIAQGGFTAPQSLGAQKAAAPSGIGAGVKTDYQSLISSILAGYGQNTPQAEAMVPLTDYQGELEAQPDWQQGLRDKATAEDTAAQARANTFRNLVIASGYNPFSASDLDPSRLGNLGQFAGDINQSTLDTAAQNQFSTRATLGRQLSDARAALPYQLAARGLARSGAAAQESNTLQRQYDVQSNQALASLLDALNQGAGGYTSALGTAASNWENTKNVIASRLAQQQGYAQLLAAQQQQTQRGLDPDFLRSLFEKYGVGGEGGGTDVAYTPPLSGEATWGTPAMGSPAGNALAKIVPTIQQGTGKKPKVVVPVGYGGGGWAYPVGKTGVIRRY